MSSGRYCDPALVLIQQVLSKEFELDQDSLNGLDLLPGKLRRVGRLRYHESSDVPHRNGLRCRQRSNHRCAARAPRRSAVARDHPQRVDSRPLAPLLLQRLEPASDHRERDEGSAVRYGIRSGAGPAHPPGRLPRGCLQPQNRVGSYQKWGNGDSRVQENALLPSIRGTTVNRKRLSR